MNNKKSSIITALERCVVEMSDMGCRKIAVKHKDGIGEFVELDTLLTFLNELPDKLEKLEKIEQIINEWNNDASHSFSDMCKINEISKE